MNSFIKSLPAKIFTILVYMLKESIIGLLLICELIGSSVISLFSLFLLIARRRNKPKIKIVKRKIDTTDWFEKYFPQYNTPWKKLYLLSLTSLVILIPSFFYFQNRVNQAQAETLSLSTSGDEITISVNNKYEATLNTADTTDYLTLKDKAEDNVTPDIVHEVVGPMIKSGSGGGAGSIETLYAESITESSTSDSTNYTTKTSISSGSFTGGDTYLIFASVGLANSSSTGRSQMQIRYDTTEQFNGIIEPDGGVTGSVYQMSWFDLYTQPGTPTSVDIRFKCHSTSVTCYASHAQLLAINISDLDVSDWEYNENTTSYTHTTTPSSRASITLNDADSTKDWLIFAMEEITRDEGNGISNRIDLYNGSTAYMQTTEEEEDTQEEVSKTIFAPFADVTSGTTFSVRVSDVGSGAAATHNTSRVFALNLDAFADQKSSYADINTAIGTTMTELGNLNSGGNYAPTTTGDQIIFANYINDTGTETQAFNDQLQVNGTTTPTSWDWTQGSGSGIAGMDTTDEVSTLLFDKISISSSGESIDLDSLEVTTSSMVGDEVSLGVFSVALPSSGSEYALRYDGSRVTTILENTDTRVRIRVSGCLDTVAGSSCLTDGTNTITVVEEYTFTPQGFFVENVTNFQTSGTTLASTETTDGYLWINWETDVTDAAFDDTASPTIYYGDGTTESSTSTDGAFEDSNTYVSLPGHGTGSYQSAIIGVTTWLDQSGGTDDWYWDENTTGTVDSLYARERGTTPTGAKTMRWFFQIHPKTTLDTETEREAYHNDYDNPDTLSITTGSTWQELGADDWNESEGTYTLSMAESQATYDIDGDTFTRNNSIYKLRGYRDTTEPTNVTLEGTTLTNGTDFNAAVKPFTDADFYDSSGTAYTQLAVGGNTANANEYLYDSSNDYTISFAASDYLYLGLDSTFTGVTTSLTTAGAGTPTITWQYCSANSDTATACDTWSTLSTTDNTTGAAAFTASGNFYWTQPGTWLESTVNSGPSLFYIRASLTAGSYTTDPVEDVITPDILVLQHEDGTISSAAQTWGITTSTLETTTETGATAVWVMDENHGTTTYDNQGTNNLSISGATWKNQNTFAARAIHLRFDGSNDYLTAPSSSDFNFGTGSFSISGWFRHPDTVSGTDVLLARYDDAGYKVYMNSSGNICFGIDDDSTWGPDDSACSTADYSDSTWHNFVVVKNTTSNIKVYIDGTEVAENGSLTATGSLNDDSPLFIGIDSDGSSNPWDGDIDQVVMHAVAKSGSEIGVEELDQSTALFGEQLPDNLSDGLIGWWKLDETALNSCTGGTNDACDSSGNGNDGTENGSMTNGDFTAGKFHNGLDFDGTDDYIDTNLSVTSNSTTPITIATWINTTDSSTTDPIIGHSNGGRIDMWRVDADLRCRGFNGGEIAANATTDINDGNWHHVACVFDEKGVAAYVDGVLEARNETSTDASAGDIYLGETGSTTPAALFDGMLDDARVYSRSLSPVEITQLYIWGPQPVIYLPFDENTGTSTAYDRSGNGNNATLVPGEESMPGSSQIVYDTFTEASNTVITSHTPDTGTGYTQIFDDSGGASATINATTDEVTGGSATNNTGQAYSAQPNPTSADQDIVFTVKDGFNESGTKPFHAFGRRTDNNNAYIVRLIANGESGDSITLYKLVAGTATSLGSYDATIATNTVIKLELRDAAKKVYVNDVERISSADNALTSAGTWGVGWGKWNGHSVINGNLRPDWDIDNLTLEEVTAGTGGKGVMEWIPGRYGTTLTYDGVDDHLTVSDATDLDIAANDTFTFEAWFRHTTQSSGQDVLLKKFESTGADGGYAITMESDGDITCGIDDDNTSFPEDSATSTAATYDDNQWHHVACVKNGTTDLTLYIDGVEIASDTSISATGTLANDDTLYIGIDGDGTSNPWLGNIDEVKMYRYARTQQQVIEDLNANHPTGGSPESSKKMHLKLDEMSGTTANDSGLLGDNGELLDGPTWTRSGKFGSAISFDGSNDRIQTFNSDDFEYTGGNMTFSTWIYPSSSDTDDSRIFSNPWNGVGQYNYNFMILSDNTIRLDLLGSTADNITTSKTIAEDTWSHLAFTIDSSDVVRIYLNAVKIHEEVHTISGWTPSSGDSNISPVIGSLYPYGTSWAGNTSFSFQGMMDEIKFYDSALTPNQIKVDMNAGSVAGFSISSDEKNDLSDGAGDDPVGYWPLDENTGTTTTYDKSGSGNDGTLTSITGSSWVPGHTGSALNLDGSADYVDVGTGPTSVKTVTFWTYPETTTEYFINLTSTTDYISASGGTVSATGFTSPTIYVNGIETTTIAADTWSHVAVVTDTAENASNLDIGRTADTNYLEGKIDDVKLFDYALTQGQVSYDYNRGAPVGWWRLDECTGSTAYDASGNGNNVTITIGGSGTNTSTGTCSSGTGTEAWNNGTTGRYNGSLDFDGTDDYVTASSGDELQASGNQLSVSAWVKRDITDSTRDNIVTRENGGTRQYQMQSLNNSPSFLFYYDDASNNQLTATTTFNTSNWYHIVATYDGTTERIYINGLLENSDVRSKTLRTGAATNYIGTLSGSNEFWDGQIDDVRIYNYALSANQVKNIMNHGVARFE